MPQIKAKFGKRKSTDGTDYSELEAAPIESDRLPYQDVESLRRQVQAEEREARKHLQSKIGEWQRRLKLYNNQKRAAKKIGEPLMFTVFQTVLASIYQDRLESTFEGRREGSDETAENLNNMAKFDYDEMNKSEVDFMWDWDTLFFGRGLVLMNEFDRDQMHPVPEVVDPLTFLRDPSAVSVAGLNGKGALRYCGMDFYFTILELEQNGSYFNLDRIQPKKTGPQINSAATPGLENLALDARMARAEAQNRDVTTLTGANETGDNAEFKGLRWFTHFKGYKVLCEWTEEWELIRFQWLVDDEGKSIRYFPLIDRPMYPTAHDWDGVSVPDLTEDKQRAASIVENLILEGVTAEVYPMYLYDKTKIKNRSDLDFSVNKFVGVDGPPGNVIQPMQKASPSSQMADYILRLMDNSSQKATATPEIQQGRVSSEQRTLGELNIVASKTDTRNSLTLKVFGWSEKRFWRQWYFLYKLHFDEHIDEKTIRISGPFGAKWRTLQRENIIAEVDPDVSVESIYVTEGERMRRIQQFDMFMQMAIQDPSANKRYMMKKRAKLAGMSKEEIDFMFPPTADELRAARENEILNENRLADKETQEEAVVKIEDNHVVHLMIHSSAIDTPALRAHVKAHQEAMRMQKENPELAPTPEQGMQPGQQSGVSGMPGQAQMGNTAPSALAAQV